ncbi:MAG TPA: gluconokinase [Albitalea sp.]|jgi:gluconokinase|nr:gluconokinase [Albitalea sp.]
MNSVVVMGVAGCGKSSLGAELARSLGWTLIEGDDFHAGASKAKMREGIALTDADRRGWLATLSGELARHPEGAVLTCSALKRRYRDQLRAGTPGLRFVFLDLDEATARQRVAARAAEHLFPPTLVASQFAALEAPTGEPGVLRVDATGAPADLLQQALAWLQSPSPEAPSR